MLTPDRADHPVSDLCIMRGQQTSLPAAWAQDWSAHMSHNIQVGCRVVLQQSHSSKDRRFFLALAKAGRYR